LLEFFAVFQKIGELYVEPVLAEIQYAFADFTMQLRGRSSSAYFYFMFFQNDFRIDQLITTWFGLHYN
jgi:glycyl-tRNA synthetase alpha subunit